MHTVASLIVVLLPCAPCDTRRYVQLCCWVRLAQLFVLPSLHVPPQDMSSLSQRQNGRAPAQLPQPLCVWSPHHHHHTVCMAKVWEHFVSVTSIPKRQVHLPVLLLLLLPCPGCFCCHGGQLHAAGSKMCPLSGCMSGCTGLSCDVLYAKCCFGLLIHRALAKQACAHSGAPSASAGACLVTALL